MRETPIQLLGKMVDRVLINQVLFISEEASEIEYFTNERVLLYA